MIGGVVILKIVATAVATSRAGAVALLSVSQHLAGLVSRGLAQDLGSVKADYLERSKAAATADCAKAQRTLTEATEAANAVIQSQEKHAVEMEALRANARIATAHAQMVEAASEAVVDAIQRRDSDWVEVAARFEDGLRRIRSKGGALLIAREELPALESVEPNKDRKTS